MSKGELIRAVYVGYATKEQAIELIKMHEKTLLLSKEIDKKSGFSINTEYILEVIKETKIEIQWIKDKYGICDKELQALSNIEI